MAATGRGDWRSARSSEALPPHLGYSRSYDHPPPAPASSYYGDSLPPSHSWGPGGSSPYHPHSSYGRAGGPPPPHYHYPPPQHQQHSPIASRDRDPDPYWDGPLSPTPSGAYDRTQPLPPYSGSTTPYRGSTASSRPRSQVIHRGSPFSSRGGGSAAARSFDRQFFPDSPYRNHRPPPGTMTTRIVLPMHRQHLPLSRNALPPAWEPPSPLEVPTKRGSHDEEDDDDDDDYVASTVNREPKAQDGSDNDEDTDPLAILAKVSSDMDSTKVKSKKTDDEGDEERGDGDQAEGGLTRAKTTEPPTSPLTRRTRSSPVITPTTDNTTNKQSKTEVSVDPSFPDVPQPPAAAAAAAKAAVAPAPAVAPSVNPPPNAEAAAAAAPLPAAGKGTPKSVTPMPAYYPPPYGEDPHGPPAHHHHHPYNASSARAPSAGYRPYAPPPANQTVHHRRAPSWGPEVHPAVVERHSFDSFDSAASAHDSPSLPPPASRRGYYPYATNPHGPPAQHYPPPRYYGAPPASSDPYHQRPPYPYPPQHASSHMDEKTVLRRKFSWKHYPEVSQALVGRHQLFFAFNSHTNWICFIIFL